MFSELVIIRKGFADCRVLAQQGVLTASKINNSSQPSLYRVDEMNLQDHNISSTGREPLVSIIIATHNYGQYISEAIESVFSQTHSNLEVIIVDDGSTDNTREIVAKYPRVKYVYQTRSGAKTPARARNNGLALSKGEFYISLDADDKLHTNYVQECVNVILKDKCIGFVWTAAQEFGESYKVRWPRTLHHRFSILRGTGGQLGAALTRRKAFDDVGGYDETLPALEDWDLAIRICRKGWKAKAIPKPLHFVRVHEGQQTSKAEKLQLDKFIEQKYPIIRLYSPVSRFFDIVVVFLSHPKTLLVRTWNKIVCRFFNYTKIEENFT